MNRIATIFVCIYAVVLNGCCHASRPEPRLVDSRTVVEAGEKALPQLIDLPEADRPKVRKQLARLAEHRDSNTWHRAYHVISREWTDAVKALIDNGKIKKGISQVHILGLLGDPTHKGEHAGRQWFRWYFDTTSIVNPAFDVEFKDGRVFSFSFSSA